MSHAYAARRSRQTAVFTAIVGLHFAAFLVIALGLVPRMPVEVWKPAPITPVPPVKPTPVVVGPSGPVELGSVVIIVEEPVIDIPVTDEVLNGPATSHDGVVTDAGASGSAPFLDDYVAPRLRTPSGNLAALIDSCYPASARRLGQEGKVIARVTIGAQGSALGWSVVQSSGFARLDSAVDCVMRKVEFIAGTRGGQAVAAEATLPIVFRLD